MENKYTIYSGMRSGEQMRIYIINKINDLYLIDFIDYFISI